jgi:hypothetical protein
MVRTVVDGQFILLSVELETTSGRAIRHPTDRAAQIAGITAKVLPEIIKPQNDVADAALPVRNQQFGDDRAVISDFGAETLRVGQREQIDSFSARGFSKQFLGGGGFHKRKI